MPEKMRDFLAVVAEQIRWKKARPGLTEELTTHLMEQRDAYLSDGMTEDEAERETLRQMGDPVSIGAELDRIHRPRPQWGLLIFAGILLTVGALLRNGLTAPLRLDDSRVPDMLSILVGIGCLAAGYLLDVSFLGKKVKWLFPIFFASLFGLFLFMPYANGQAWLPERLMPLFPVLLAALMWSQRGKGWGGAAISLIGAGAGLCAACMIPSLFTVFLVILSALALGLLFTWRDWFGVGKRTGVTLTLLMGGSAMGYLIWRSWDRWQYAFFPETDPSGVGYFASAIRKALTCAQWIGSANTDAWEVATGFPLYRVVPEMEGVCLLVNMICRFGWLPFLVLMTAFTVFFGWALWKAIHLRQALGRAVTLSALVTLLTQAAVALLVTLGVPIMSASFPLVVGNWASVINMFLVGLMLSAFRDGALPESQCLAERSYRYKLIVKLERI